MNFASEFLSHGRSFFLEAAWILTVMLSARNCPPFIAASCKMHDELEVHASRYRPYSRLAKISDGLRHWQVYSAIL